ncbi:MAG: CBS domain-containing protein [Proteobacteria bacterium]|nr:MAG: CBS domain-containing protein [Pseudomonadota bacterium]
MNDGQSSRPYSGSMSNWLRRSMKFLTPAPTDRQHIIELLHEAEHHHLIDTGTVAMMEGALLVSELKVRDIMVPRSKMVFIEEDAKLADILPEVIESGHSRFPVLDDKHAKVLGILLAKDLLAIPIDTESSFDIKDIMRPPVFIPDSKRLNILLREFRASRNHLAIVLDEYGEIDGLVSIEDVIEQIVGEIDDEHDIEDEEFIRQHRGNRFTVKAHTPIDTFNEYFASKFDDATFDTIGGLATDEFGHVPGRAEKIEFGGFEFKVLRADKRRIHVLRVIRLAEGREPD